MDNEYFLKIYDEIDKNNYLEFKNIDMSIGTDVDVFKYDIFYFKITSNSSRSNYSNVSIYGQYQDNNISDNIYHTKKIATFFKHSNINFGIEELLNNTFYLNKMKLKILFTDTIGFSLNMKTYIYIEKQFLLSLYLYSELPRFLFKIIIDTPKENYFIPYNKIKNNIYINNIQQLKKVYKRELFNHQINNIIKMNNIENNNKIRLSKLPNNQSILIYNLYDINERLLCNNHGKVLNEDDFDYVDLEINGGVLCDNIGLGKTTSMIGLISENLNDNINDNNTTLLLCPTRLCKQWIEEIDKTYNLKYKHILNIRQFKKLTVDDYKLYDLIIIHYNFVINDNYINLCMENPNNPKLLHNYNWNRLILDEGHEIIKCTTTKKINLIYNYLKSINTNKKWIVSGTPYSHMSDFNEIVNFLCNKYSFNDETLFHLSNYSHNYKIIYDSIFIKNNLDDINIIIPKPNIETIFLDMSPIERNIYDSAFDDNIKKFEF